MAWREEGKEGKRRGGIEVATRMWQGRGGTDRAEEEERQGGDGGRKREEEQAMLRKESGKDWNGVREGGREKIKRRM